MIRTGTESQFPHIDQTPLPAAFMAETANALRAPEAPLDPRAGSLRERAARLQGRLSDAMLNSAVAVSRHARNGVDAAIGAVIRRRPKVEKMDTNKLAHFAGLAGMAVYTVGKATQLYFGTKHGVPVSAGGDLSMAGHVNAAVEAGQSAKAPSHFFNAAKDLGQAADAKPAAGGAAAAPNSALATPNYPENPGVGYMSQPVEVTLKSGDTVWGDTLKTLNDMGFDTGKMSTPQQTRLVHDVLKMNGITWQGAHSLQPGARIQLGTHAGLTNLMQNAVVGQGGKPLEAAPGSPFATAQHELSGSSTPTPNPTPRNDLAPHTGGIASSPAPAPVSGTEHFHDNQYAGKADVRAPAPAQPSVDLGGPVHGHVDRLHAQPSLDGSTGAPVTANPSLSDVLRGYVASRHGAPNAPASSFHDGLLAGHQDMVRTNAPAAVHTFNDDLIAGRGYVGQHRAPIAPQHIGSDGLIAGKQNYVGKHAALSAPAPQPISPVALRDSINANQETLFANSRTARQRELNAGADWALGGGGALGILGIGLIIKQERRLHQKYTAEQRPKHADPSSNKQSNLWWPQAESSEDHNR